MGYGALVARQLLQLRGGNHESRAAFVVDRVRGEDDSGLFNGNENPGMPPVLANDGLADAWVGGLAQAGQIR